METPVSLLPTQALLPMQTQVDKYLALDGATFYYIAMFDEVNEGTAIYKAVSKKENLPANDQQFVWLDMEGGDHVPSDHYLRMDHLLEMSGHLTLPSGPHFVVNHQVKPEQAAQRALFPNELSL